MPVLIAAVSAHCHDGPPLNNRFRPMHYDFFAFGRLDGVQALTIASISEVYTNVIELSQSVYTLKGELVRCRSTIMIILELSTTCRHSICIYMTFFCQYLRMYVCSETAVIHGLYA